MTRRLDVLLSQIPMVLRAELYAIAALAGAALVVIMHVLQVPSAYAAIVAAILCFGLRLLAISRGWNLPVVRRLPGSDDEIQR
jgi:uncharacterized membrane protein YeiH